MAVLKCTVCGGELDINGDMTVGICKYCDSTIIIPQNLDRRGNLYNRAVFLRQNNEFDKASSVYEEILKDDNSDAEAHWGLVLSKYGIEYVDDPKTGKKIPTCHRTQATSVLNDIDYKASLEYAAPDAKSVIENEAKRISDIQKKILEISHMESPYDIFICYKESDDLGNRTKDSTLAQDIYYELTKRGYNVFFARKSLESRLGTEYEPIIYGALNSSKIMVVVGTRPEYFNSVWVRNEWSRFSEMGRDSNKTIIPAYKDMSPYELPSELSALQSLDMSKLGFMQDLMDGIDKILQNKSSKIDNNGNSIDNSNINDAQISLDRLIKNGETYLALENYEDAKEVYTSITKNYPEDYRGWWGRIISNTKRWKLISNDQRELNELFGYVRKLAPSNEYKNCEEEYVSYTNKIAEQDLNFEKNRIRGIINNLKGQINTINDNINHLKKDIDREKDNLNRVKENNNVAINKKEKDIYKSEENVKFKTIMFVITLVLTISTFGIFSTKHYGWGFLLGFFMVFFWMYTSVILSESFRDSNGNTDKRSSTLRIQSYRADILSLQEQNKKAEKDSNRNIMMYNNRINTKRKLMKEVEDKISKCNQYLSIGDDRIVKVLFAIRCKSFDVEVETDQEVSEIRNTVLGFDNRK